MKTQYELYKITSKELLDAIGHAGVGPLQYVDDTTITCSSPGQVRAIVNKHVGSACAQFALKTKTKFHCGPNKTLVMAMFDNPS